MKKQVLAFDFGASSGRAILGTFDGEKITLKELKYYARMASEAYINDPVYCFACKNENIRKRFIKNYL